MADVKETSFTRVISALGAVDYTCDIWVEPSGTEDGHNLIISIPFKSHAQTAFNLIEAESFD